MKARRITEALNRCANQNCYTCDLKSVPRMYCQQKLIKKMAKECKELVEEIRYEELIKFADWVSKDNSLLIDYTMHELIRIYLGDDGK